MIRMCRYSGAEIEGGDRVQKKSMLNVIRLAVRMTALSMTIASAHAAEPIKIGFAVAQSGWMEAYDKGALRAALMAIDDINSKGGLLGRQVVADVRDTRTDVKRTAQVAQELLAQDVPFMIVSCDYDMGSPAALAAESAGKISMFLCASDFKAGAQGIGPHAYSASSAAVTEGATVAEWLRKKRNVRTAYTLLDTSIQYDRALCSGFEWEFGALDGAKLVGKDTFENGDTSIASQITRIKSLATPPDAVMLCSYLPGAGSAIRQMRAAGINALLVSGTAMDGDYWLNTVPKLANFVGIAKASIRGDDPRPEVNEVTKRYTQKFGAAPVNQSVFDGYVAVQYWAIAVKQAGTFDPAKVAAAMDKFTNQSTLLGPRSFTPDLHIQTRIPYLLTEVVDGRSKVVDQWTLSRDIPLSVLMKQ